MVRCLLCQQRIPRTSRRKSPEVPAGTRVSPHGYPPKDPPTAGIPAYSRSARNCHDRPVTPEVAGSSPVAPVKSLQISRFCCPSRRKRPPAFTDPAHIPHGNPPLEPGRSREFPQPFGRPDRPEVASRTSAEYACLQVFRPARQRPAASIPHRSRTPSQRGPHCSAGLPHFRRHGPGPRGAHPVPAA
jgi:hypothetical protein